MINSLFIVISCSFNIFASDLADCMKIIRIFSRLIGRFKYIITILVSLVILGAVGENSWLSQREYNSQIRQLKAEIGELNRQYKADSLRLDELDKSPQAIEKIARERYFMKADDEDIFVLSDEIEGEEDDEATE